MKRTLLGFGGKIGKIGDLDNPDKEGLTDNENGLGTVLVRFWST